MEQHRRYFKGLWMPEYICNDTNLSPTDKFVWAQIDSLSSQEKGCYASNRYLANISQCSERQITRTIALLKELGYITTEEVEGKYRIIHPTGEKNKRVDKMSIGIDELSMGIDKMSTNNIDNNKNNSIKLKNTTKEDNVDYKAYTKEYYKKRDDTIRHSNRNTTNDIDSMHISNFL